MSPAIRWVVAATLVLAAALGIGRFAYTPLLPDMVSAFGWNFAQAGDVASANFLGYMIGALLAPKLALSPRVRLWVAFSLMASVATTSMGSLVSDYLGWLLLRASSGVASAFCLVIVTTHLIYAIDRYQATRLGNVHFAGVGIGILVCMTVLLDTVDIFTMWNRLGAAAAAMMAVAWIILSRENWRVPDNPVAQPERTHASRARLWPIIVGYGLFGYGYVVSATFVVAMAEQLNAHTGVGGLGVGLGVGIVWWVVGLALVPSVYVWQWVANRFGIMPTLLVAYFVEAVGAGLAGTSESLTWLLVACVLLGGTFAAITALGISAAREAAPDRVAYAVSSMTIAFALGQLVGPSVSGRLADHYGDFLLASLFASGLLVIAGLLVWFAAKPARGVSSDSS